MLAVVRLLISFRDFGTDTSMSVRVAVNWCSVRIRCSAARQSLLVIVIFIGRFKVA